ncbi:DnaB-like helicase N-terminal domain-containing protein [Pararoseomonas sp. SCSIO 73927]|uniref:DnaB-like helicase N-terminal domain-containing protein n=1 Tax=Pararoseomonas sp. SCSIO 73927 TaxID=3114537 RepID=UPI0030D0A36B
MANALILTGSTGRIILGPESDGTHGRIMLRIEDRGSDASASQTAILGDRHIRKIVDYLQGRAALNVPPSDIEAEQLVLGSVLAHTEFFRILVQDVSRRVFVDPVHQRIWDAIELLHGKGVAPTTEALRDYFECNDDLGEVGGPAYLTQLASRSCTLIVAAQLAGKLEDMRLAREAMAGRYDTDADIPF